MLRSRMLRSHMLAMLPAKGACKYTVCKTFLWFRILRPSPVHIWDIFAV